MLPSDHSLKRIETIDFVWQEFSENAITFLRICSKFKLKGKFALIYMLEIENVHKE
jgi:hypothetical protein